MQITDLLRAHEIPTFLRLGKLGTWITLHEHIDTNDETRSRLQVSLTDAIKSLPLSTVERLRKMSSYMEVIATQVLSLVVANGAKVFRPSLSQCEAMSNTELRVKVSDYSQPYPVLITELPLQFSDSLAPRPLPDMDRWWQPKFLIHWWNQRDNFQVTLAFSDSAGGHFDGVLLTPKMYTSDQTMEELLKASEHIPKDASVTEWNDFRKAQRIALNFGLLLTHLGHTERPFDVRTFSRFQRMRRRHDERSQEMAARSNITLLELKQSVTVFDERPLPSEDHGGTHASPKPHWRRGHWRTQVHGVGRKERKLIFVKPVFVREFAFAGDKSDTQTEYKLRERPSTP